MDVVLLGTGTPTPDPDRAGAATLLFDCGRAVVMRLAGAGVSLDSLTPLLLTHLHSDHTWALNDVLTTRWLPQFEERASAGRRAHRNRRVRPSDAGGDGSRRRVPDEAPSRPRLGAGVRGQGGR
jgi:ribonuclease BN (tRNA processing enzyme)